ncbi:hypothetical protein AZE42_06147 [Rhizopogon vesiculosus]|uniref:Protein kinase domain-containing protein n=1 Tax=Rhizopogon vesiculosus TaxID=180088 RepID=A0A1J8PSR4_9AGAM|nr:hypothetical protein AZE42_06147 [Rhizopogon vesiculosus]
MNLTLGRRHRTPASPHLERFVDKGPHYYLAMGNCLSQKSVETNGTPHQLINFKIEPPIIPAKEVTKSGTFPSGTGGLGDVWKCSWSQRSGTCEVAVKSVRIPQSDDTQLVEKAGQRIRREAYVWISLNHDNILKLHGIVEGFGLLPALVSPWIENGSLDSYLRQHIDLSKDETLKMCTTKE